jgi:hypothetical protein
MWASKYRWWFALAAIDAAVGAGVQVIVWEERPHRLLDIIPKNLRALPGGVILKHHFFHQLLLREEGGEEAGDSHKDHI